MESTELNPSSPGLQRILGTLELFEMVLASLPMKDLLFAQLVCKQWKMTIEASPRLQEALFFKPASIEQFLESPSSTTSSTVKQSSPSPELANTGVKLTSDAFQRNPLLETKFKTFFARPVKPRAALGPPELLSISWNDDDRSRATYARADASWRRMLLVQPASAITDIEILYMTHAMGGDGLSIADKPIQPLVNGLRIGWVYDRCYEMILRYGSFALRWHMLKSERLFSPRLTIFFSRSIQCVKRSTHPKEWDALRSEAFSNVEIEYRRHDWTLQKSDDGPAFRGRRRVPRHIIYDEEDLEISQKG